MQCSCRHATHVAQNQSIYFITDFLEQKNERPVRDIITYLPTYETKPIRFRTHHERAMNEFVTNNASRDTRALHLYPFF